MSQSMEEESNSSIEDIITFHVEARQDQDVSIACPWYGERTQKIKDPILRMHNEAIDFYLYTLPTNEEHEKNIAFYEKAKKMIQEQCGSALIVAPFLLNKLYLKDTQADCYLLVNQRLNQEFASNIAAIFTQTMNVNVVPDTSERYQIFEIEIESEGARMVIRMMQRNRWEEYLQLIDQSLIQIIEIKFIYCIIACTIRQRWLNLNIRPYLLFSLISVFYHERRKHKVRTLTENIIKFIEYYGVGPFQERKINYLGKNRYELVQQGPPPTPFSFWINQRTNIANPTLKQLFNFLKNRYRLISNYNFDEEQSIIGLLVNPCKKAFTY